MTTTTGQWVLDSAQEGIKSLKYDASTAAVTELGPEDVLVKMHAASLNYRDLVICKVSSPLE